MLPLPLLADVSEAPLDLADGRTIRFGRLSPASRPLIEQAMLRLSPTTSRRRFFTVRYRLSERELDALTGPETPERLALGASAHFPDGRVEGVAVARYVRVPGDPLAAEIAVTVVDDYQRLGIGRRLLALLGREARRRGVQRLTGLVLPDNVPMLALLDRHARGLVRRMSAGLVAVEIPLS
jgi:GNAT superfamily N-acetyltransferase